MTPDALLDAQHQAEAFPMLFKPSSQGLIQLSTHWYKIKDGDELGLALFKRHYSYRPYADGRQPKLFVGPGEKIVMISDDGAALFVWRSFRSADAQQGVNCSVFRNEGKVRSSQLIREAMEVAWLRWPGTRLYTYVNPRQIKSTNPGYCFLKAGWKRCGTTKIRQLVILEAVSQEEGVTDVP